MKLNCGCGRDYREGYVNIDKVEGVADVVHDLNVFPWPFDDDSCELVLLKHVLEHLDDVIAVMEEVWRVLRPKGEVTILVPYYTHFQALTHVQHKHYFGYSTLDLVTPASSTVYTYRLFRYKERKLYFDGPCRLFFEWFAHRWVGFYTTTFLTYLYPASEVKIVLQPIK